ncbi:hypothetical protein [Bradyrhizobium sp. McL0615]|uniref:hypothetical protein n=1 Tax=Bradyrhizobium sp. McL0615 TaxID=3415673 RepID=UPI003CECBF6D
MQKMQATIQEAKCIVFLGFAYHKQNMALLEPGKRTRTTKQVNGTAFGMSDSDVGEVMGELDSFFPANKIRPAAERSESYGISFPVMDLDRPCGASREISRAVFPTIRNAASVGEPNSQESRY